MSRSRKRSCLNPCFVRGVPPGMREAVRWYARRFGQVTRIDHVVPVIVVPTVTVAAPDGTLGFGVFHPINWCECEIWLGGAIPPDAGGCSAEAWVCGTFAHEVAHYEQWRDRRELQERGVEVRARNLLAMVHRGVGLSVAKPIPRTGTPRLS